MEEAPKDVWRSISASAIGTSHIVQGTSCQDAFKIVKLNNGRLVIAVADGAGSAKRSEEGSRCAVEVGTRFLAERPGAADPASVEECESLLVSALDECRAALERLSPGEKLGEIATTLLLTLVTDRWLSTIQVGDGGVVCRHASGLLQVLSVLGQSEYINETTFLTSSDYSERAHKMTIPAEGVTGLAMFTDGIELLALRYSDNTAHGPFFSAMFEFARNSESSEAELREFLESERVCERTDDDKTLVLAVRNDIYGQ